MKPNPRTSGASRGAVTLVPMLLVALIATGCAQHRLWITVASRNQMPYTVQLVRGAPDEQETRTWRIDPGSSGVTIVDDTDPPWGIKVFDEECNLIYVHGGYFRGAYRIDIDPTGIVAVSNVASEDGSGPSGPPLSPGEACVAP